MVDLIPHAPGPGPLPRKSWRIDGCDSEWRYLVMCCPNGHLGTVQHLSHPHLQDSGHTIAPDGTVQPSVVCPTKGCDYHQFVRLEGWSESMRRG